MVGRGDGRGRGSGTAHDAAAQPRNDECARGSRPSAADGQRAAGRGAAGHGAAAAVACGGPTTVAARRPQRPPQPAQPATYAAKHAGFSDTTSPDDTPADADDCAATSTALAGFTDRPLFQVEHRARLARA